MSSSPFTLKRVTVRNGGFTYDTYRLAGQLNGQRIRKNFKDKAEALGEKQRLEVEAANAGGDVSARNTRLSGEQLTEAEAAFARLGDKSLAAAVDWYLTTYRPPAAPMGLQEAETAFLAEKKHHVRAPQLRDYTGALRNLREAFPERHVHEITTHDVQQFLAARAVGKKRFNNLRGNLHAFFTYCQLAPRMWIRDNPVTPIPQFKITRGVPEIIDVERARELMAYVATYRGGPRSQHQPGFLAPYFALCLFAGLRPSTRDGEVRKLAEAPATARAIDHKLGVIRVAPDISKVKSVRQIKIRPNLTAWLKRYPASKFPIMVRGLEGHVAHVREKFQLSVDVLRHTFISMHVATFKSLGEAALEAGNSEAMIKKHYLNMVTTKDAKRFWAIVPV